jgi:hypothetical protein
MAQLTKADAQNLSKNATFSKGVAQLFLKPSTMTPTQIVQLLAMTGVNVPKGVFIGADVAQLIISGGAISSAIDDGASIGAFVAPSAAIIGATMDILERSGLVSAQSPAAQIINFGVDVALVAGSCGTNVIADLKLVMDIASAFNGPAAAADGAARSAVAKYINDRRVAQSEAFSKDFADFHNKKISVFGLMVDAAKDAPDLFYNYFPDAKTFVPPGYYTVTAYASASNGITNSSSTFQQDVTTVNQSLSTVKAEIFKHYIGQYLDQYKAIDTAGPDRISVRTAALLSLLPPFIDTYPLKFDLTRYLAGYNLTFSDLGEDHIIPNTFDQLNELSPPTISIDGQPVFADQKAGKAYTSLKSNYGQYHLNVMKYDQSGDFQNMVKWMDKDTYAYILNNSMPKWDIDPGKSGQLRTIKNFWAVMQMLDSAKNDPAFVDANNYYVDHTSYQPSQSGFTKLGIPQQYLSNGQPMFGNVFTPYQQFGTTDDFDQKARVLNFKSHCRGLNKLAAKNIASFLNTTPDKLYIQNKSDFGKGPAVFGVNK